MGKIEAKTPLGVLSALIGTDSIFPSIEVEFIGNDGAVSLLAKVEYEPDDQVIRTLVFKNAFADDDVSVDVPSMIETHILPTNEEK